MNGQHGTRMRIVARVLAAVAVAFTWAGATATAWPAAPGLDCLGRFGCRCGQAGSWGRAIQVPGLAALNTGGDAEVASVSCASAGNCAAGGDYSDGDAQQGFVAVERDGRWHTAIEVPGLAALNIGRDAYMWVRCRAPRRASCAAVGGDYVDGDGQGQGFVVG